MASGFDSSYIFRGAPSRATNEPGRAATQSIVSCTGSAPFVNDKLDLFAIVGERLFT